MRSRLSALMLGFAAVLGSVDAPQAKASAPLAYSWCYAGCYACYKDACAKARYFQACGYCTKIVSSGSSYVVYYHH